MIKNYYRIIAQKEKTIIDGPVNLNGRADKEGFTKEDADPDQLEMGIKVEMEHTDDPKIAEKIAIDHLSEISDYYTRLNKMESEA